MPADRWLRWPLPRPRAGWLILLLLVGLWAPAGAESSRSSARHREVEAARVAAAESGRGVALFFGAAWCPYCHEMKRDVLDDPRVREAGASWVWVEVDIDRNPSLARRYGVVAVPEIVFLDADGEPERRLIGGYEVEELAAALRGKEPEVLGRASALVWTPRGYRGRGLCFSHVGYGPLHLSSQSPFQSLRLAMQPRTPSTLGRGQLEVRGTGTWVNLWSLDEEAGVEIDAEMLQLTATVAYGLSDTVQVEASYERRSRFGGALDGLIQNFHDLFGIDQQGRLGQPRGRLHTRLLPPGAEEPLVIDEADRGVFAEGLSLTMQHNLTCGTRHLPAISYSLTVRVDTADELDSSRLRDLDFGASLAFSRRLGRFYGYLTLGWTYFGDDRLGPLVLRSSQSSVLAALEWPIAPRHGLLLHYLATEGTIDGFGPFDNASDEITLGWKWELRPRTVLEVGLVENVISFDNSPDFGVHVGLSHRY